MRNRLLVGLAGVVTATVLVVTPVGAQAARLITGKDVKDSSLTGADVKDSSLTGKDVKGGSLDGTDLSDGSVTGGDVADGGITGADLADGGVTSADLADGTVTGTDVSDGSVTGADVTNGTIGGADITDGSLGGTDLTDGSVTGADVDESTLAAVASANSLSPLPSGETMSGVFTMAGGVVDGGGTSYLGASVNYPRPLADPIPDEHIIDTGAVGFPAECPGAGQAAPGYMCLYFDFHAGISDVYGWSDRPPYSDLPMSIGVALYAHVDSVSNAYADGIWTVTAP